MKLDDKIDELFELREKKRKLEDEIKEIKAEIDEGFRWLISKYGEVGTVTARGRLASATITETVVPTVEDWGEVVDWVMANDGVYLLHRRISAGPWKELLDSGETVPGIIPFTKKSISLTKLRD